MSKACACPYSDSRDCFRFRHQIEDYDDEAYDGCCECACHVDETNEEELL